MNLAKEIRQDQQRACELGLSASEITLYDAIIQNDSAILELGDETLKTIARELVTTIQKSTTIDWTFKESVRARMRSRIKRLLAKYKIRRTSRKKPCASRSKRLNTWQRKARCRAEFRAPLP